MPGTARDLGLRVDVGQRWEPKPLWLRGCPSWYIAWRCFLNSCSSLDACLGVESRNHTWLRKHKSSNGFKKYSELINYLFRAFYFTSNSERCTLAPSLFAARVPPSTVGMITTPDWLSVTCPSWLGSFTETSGWKVELLRSAGKMVRHCQ